jgi:uncharacterized protein (DUF58 family)
MSTAAREDDGAAGAADDVDAFADLRYRLSRNVRSATVGGHRGLGLGADGRFHGLAPLVDFPDPRHIDIAASIRDPAGTVFVRRFRQPSRATVFALLDLSASMGLVGTVDRTAVAELLVAGLARMVRRSGDRFGLVAARGEPDGPAVAVPANRRADLPAELRRTLAATGVGGTGIARLAEAARECLPQRPALVFLISDFQVPPEALEALLGTLVLHDVRPIVLRDSLAENPPPRFGFARIRDLETGRAQVVMTRRATLALWRAARERHRAALKATFASFGLSPIEITDQIDVDAFFEALAGQGIVS